MTRRIGRANRYLPSPFDLRPMESIYKVLRETEWAEARAKGFFAGSADDARDGFIHFSTAAQLRGTLERHFAAAAGLVVLEVAPGKLGPGLEWEPSRGGELFPHLYGVLSVDAVTRVIPVSSRADGTPVLPAEFP